MRSNLSSAVRNNILHAILPDVCAGDQDGDTYAAQALAQANVSSIIFGS